MKINIKLLAGLFRGGGMLQVLLFYMLDTL